MFLQFLQIEFCDLNGGRFIFHKSSNVSGRCFYTIIKNVLFSSPTNVLSYRRFMQSLECIALDRRMFGFFVFVLSSTNTIFFGILGNKAGKLNDHNY